MNNRFHIHYARVPEGALDSYSRALDRDQFHEAVRSVSADGIWTRVSARLDRFLVGFGELKPVRVPAALLFHGERDDVETSLYDAIGRLEYEPLYGEEVRRVRAQLDERTQYGGPVPGRIEAEVAAATEDLRHARNRILHFVMTSTFRIVLTRRVVDPDGTPWLVISVRDTDRQDPDRIDVVAATEEEQGRFVYCGSRASMLPSSSLESAWTCHARLAVEMPEYSTGLLHCHALAALNLDRHARDKGRVIDDVLDGVQTVKGISRTPEFGERLAGAFRSGARLCFRAGEGVWAAAASVHEASATIVDTLREIRPEIAGVLVAK